MIYLALTIVAVFVVDILFLGYPHISFFCLLAGLGTLHLINIVARNKCSRMSCLVCLIKRRRAERSFIA